MTGTSPVTSARSHWGKTLPVPCAGAQPWLPVSPGRGPGRQGILGFVANPSISLLGDLEFPLQRRGSAAAAAAAGMEAHPAGTSALPSWTCSGNTGIRFWGL